MNKYNDVGHKIGGALKDIRRGQILDDALVSEMTNIEKESLINKNNLWPTPDYITMLSNGISPMTVGLIKMLRDRLPSKPRLITNLSHGNLDIVYKSYTKILQKINNTIPDLKTPTDFFTLIKNIYASFNAFPNAQNKIVLTPEQEIQFTSVVNKDYKLPFSFTEDDLIKAQKDIVKLFEEKRLKQLRNEWRVITFNYGNDIGKRYGFIHYDNKMKQDIKYGKNGRLKEFFTSDDLFSTKEEALSHKQKIIELEKNYTKKSKEPSIIRNSHLLRTGPQYRNGNITPIQLKNTFGMAGIEFGESLSSKERQNLLNQSYDSFADLAHILNIPYQNIGLNNSLFLAFGSRGKTRTAAHYEPDKHVINLTRLKGAGALAHEYGHALDHYIFRRYNGDQYVTENKKRYSIMSSNFPEELPENEFIVWKKLMNTILYTHENKKSNFLSEAEKSIKLKYYASHQELFARSFECYIFDSLQQKNQINDYLVNNVGPTDYIKMSMSFNPYPCGEERIHINQHIQKMLSICFEKEISLNMDNELKNTSHSMGEKIPVMDTFLPIHPKKDLVDESSYKKTKNLIHSL